MENFSIYAVFSHAEMGLAGNTAAVISMQELPDSETMQKIASDLNQPATTFLVPMENKGNYQVRWFAPDEEIGLCGHGTLAAIAHLSESSDQNIQLLTGSHELSGKRVGADKAAMTLDSIPHTGSSAVPDGLEAALGVSVAGYYPTSNKDIVLLDTEEDLVGMQPDFQALKQIKVFGYAVTALGESVDFVSRTLVPHVQQLEDHATGSSHAALAPFWAERLGNKEMTAIQRSPRGGYFECTVSGNETTLTGSFTQVASGQLRTDE